MTTHPAGPVRVSVVVPLDASSAFAALVEELGAALGREGIRFEGGPTGRVTEGNVELGSVTSWEPGRRFLLRWRPTPWLPQAATEIEARVEAVEGGSRLTVEHRGLAGAIGSGGDFAGWFASQLAAPILSAATPRALGDWITDRQARRPSGAEWRAVYRDPLYHYPNFRVILSELALRPSDHLLEVGCGGGALLREALTSRCRASAVDHSRDMVRLAREVNHEAVSEGRLEVLEASAESLPFPDATFTCAAMTGVLGFLPEPVMALAEIRRVLADGGRLVVLGSDPELRGTPGAPEPMASRLRFYDDDGLDALAREAGLGAVRVVRRDLEPYAREVGIPEEHLPFFSGPGTRFLLAQK